MWLPGGPVVALDTGTGYGATAEGEPTAEAVVDCRHVGHEYTRRSGRSWLRRSNAPPSVTALADVSLSLSRGEVAGLAGPSGSGKSTLIHVLAGLLVPSEGTVNVAGVDLTAVSANERARFRYRHVGLVFQRFHLLSSLSARGNVALPLVEAGVPKRKRHARAEDLLEAVGLGDRTTHKPGELSGGEQQRVAIARALVTDPDLLLMDEPTGELDSETSARVLETIRSFATSRAVVVASHDQQTLEATDRVVRLHDGRIANDGS
jgi:putative ABC transport system ATP-binding protein